MIEATSMPSLPDQDEAATVSCAKCDRGLCPDSYAPSVVARFVQAGLKPVCKDCYNDRERARYAKKKIRAGHMESKRATWAKFYVTARGRVTNLFNSSKNRSKTLGVDFDLTREWIAERLERGHCEVTGIPFVLETGGGKGHRTNSFSPSVDRIKQDGGYTQDNCQLVVWIYNRARGAFPDAHFDRMLNALTERRLAARVVTSCC